MEKTVRFGGHLLEAIQEYSNGITDNYSIITRQLVDPTTPSQQLIDLLNQFFPIVDVLDKSKKKLVHEILSIKWALREREVIELYLNLLVALISANSVHQSLILDCLVRHLIPQPDAMKATQRFVSYDELFSLIHSKLRKIFSLIPMTTDAVVPLLAVHAPFVKKEFFVIECFVKNLLEISRYQPSLRKDMLELVLNKALKLDLLAPKDVVQKSYEDEENLFEMETDSPIDNETFVCKIDTVMEVLLQYIQDFCYIGGHLTGNADSLFCELLQIFDKLILPVHDSSHVQFIYFLMCSFKNEFLHQFVNHLWKKVLNPNSPVLVRQTIFSYLASLFARGKFIPFPVVLQFIESLTKWIHSYLNEREGSDSFLGGVHDAFRHGVCYSACQSLFYVLVFRVGSIMELDDGEHILRKLQLEHIVMSRLNPLKFCVSTVVDLFASLMRQHQILFCDTIIEKNQRHSLPISGQSLNKSSINPLDSFFPFDPYCLKTSKHRFDDIYQEWEGRVPQVDDDDDNDEENDQNLMNVAPMSIPNIFDDDKVVGSSLSGKSYGVSPGFSLITPSPF